MSFGFFGFQKVDMDRFDFNVGGRSEDPLGSINLDVSINPVFVDPLPEPSPSPSFAGSLLGFGDSISGGGSLNGSLSAGVGDDGDSFSSVSIDTSDFWF